MSEGLKLRNAHVMEDKYTTFPKCFCVQHLHLTDFGRWSIESKVFPELNVGYPSGGYPAGVGDGKFWTQDEVRALVVYARLRGVRLIPEIEVRTGSPLCRQIQQNCVTRH